MTEQNPEVPVDEQSEETTDGELTHGGEGVFSSGDQPEVSADEPEDSEPVEVAPAEAPGLLDKFEVTPERGHRLKG